MTMMAVMMIAMTMVMITQAVRAAIEKMAEEGEVYTGVFTQVIISITALGKQLKTTQKR